MAPPVRSDGSVLLTVLFYSVLMLVVPIGVYFATSYAIESHFKLTPRDSYLYAAGMAVIMVHVILAAFVYRAFKETDDHVPVAPLKQD